jgi:hypothetical protein
MHAIAGRRTGVVSAAALALLLILVPGSPAHSKDESSPGFISQVGIGAGSFVRTQTEGDNISRFAVGLESKVGAILSDHVALFLLAAVAFNDSKAAVDYTRWVSQEDEYTLLRALFLGWLIPLAFFADSQMIVGPGITFYTSRRQPSLYVEAGGGFSIIPSIADRSYLFGTGVFGGLGVEITDWIGFGARAIWAPSALHSRWTRSDDSVLSVLAMLQLGRSRKR